MSLQNIFSTHSIPVAEHAIHFSNARHKAIANNIANLETPGYKAIDVSKKDFMSLLDRALKQSREYDTRPILFEGGGTVSYDGTVPEYKIIERDEAGILRHDGNNVDIDQEITELVKNRGLHNVSVSIISHQFNMLRSAISGRVT